MLIALANVAKTYTLEGVAVRALRGVSLTIEAGEFVAIMGPSGSGKSTLMHILGLLDAPDSGDYTLLGRATAAMSDNDLAALRNATIGFVFQHFNLLARTRALENVMLPTLYARGPRDEAKARRVLEDVGLGDRLHHRPNELSGGQQQRVAIARALIRDPRLIMADEPTGNLDSASAEEILGLLRRLNARGITIVMVTHEADVARHARRIIRMRDGLIQSDERTDGEAATSPALGCRSRSQIGDLVRGSAHGGAPPTPDTVPSATALPAPDKAFLLTELPHHLRQAGRALLANKVRTGLSMLGILIGVAAVIAMLAIGTGARRSIEASLSSMGSNLLSVRSGARRLHGVAMEAGSVTRMTLQDAADIRQSIPSAKHVAGSVMGRGQVTSGNKNWSTQILGTVPDYAPMRAMQPPIGRFFTEEEDLMRARVAVIGMTPLRELFGDASPIGAYLKINKVSFQVIGVLPEKGASTWRDQDDLIVIPLSAAMYRLLGRDYLDAIDVEVDRAEHLEEAQDAIREMVIRNHRLPPSQRDSFDVRNMAEIQAAMTETSRTMAWLLASIAAVSLLVGGIGIMNIMLVSVTERTREIGIRKAVGARRRDILAQFLTEALAVSLIGGGLGIGLGWGISLAVARLAGWPAVVTFQSVALACGFSAVIGIVFGLWPARQAARLHPIDALRYE